jgi:hypothetical protein
VLFAASLQAAPLDGPTVTGSGSPASPQAFTLAQAGAVNPPIPASVLRKLDAQLVLALKQHRGEAPDAKVASAPPDIPIRDGDRVLVDLDASVSPALLNAVTAAGGQLAPSPDAARIVRAMVPLGSIEALAARGDVSFVTPAHLYHESKPLLPSPAPASAGAKP